LKLTHAKAGAFRVEIFTRTWHSWDRECSTRVLHRKIPAVREAPDLKDYFAIENRWRREWDSRPIAVGAPKTQQNKASAKRTAEVCDHRCVPPFVDDKDSKFRFVGGRSRRKARHRLY
jgi:hypothetical protein